MRIDLCRLKLLELLVVLEYSDATPVGQHQRYYPIAAIRAAQAVYNRITERFDKHTPVELMATEEGLSATALKACFKALYGMPVYTYQKRFRMQKAAEFLRDENISVAEVAARTGYENAAKFSAAFKAVIGCTPTVYRRTPALWNNNNLLD